jgi:Cu/Ag efflux protein CusF
MTNQCKSKYTVTTFYGKIKSLHIQSIRERFDVRKKSFVEKIKQMPGVCFNAEPAKG